MTCFISQMSLLKYLLIGFISRWSSQKSSLGYCTMTRIECELRKCVHFIKRPVKFSQKKRSVLIKQCKMYLYTFNNIIISLGFKQQKLIHSSYNSRAKPLCEAIFHFSFQKLKYSLLVLFVLCVPNINFKCCSFQKFSAILLFICFNFSFSFRINNRRTIVSACAWKIYLLLFICIFVHTLVNVNVSFFVFKK